MSADLMFDSETCLSPASADVRDLMEITTGGEIVVDESTIDYKIEKDLKNGETSNCLVIADDPAGDDTPIYECQLEPLDLTMMSELNNSLKQLGIKRPADFIGNDKIKQRRVNSDLRVKADNLRRAKQDEPRQRKVKEWWKT